MVAEGAPTSMQSLFLIDDHPVVALGLSMALAGHQRIRLTGTGTDPRRALRAIAAEKPDLLVIDLVYDGEAQLGLVRDSRAAVPDALIVVFTSLPAKVYEPEALRMGADAFIGKSTDMAALVDRITTLADAPQRPRHTRQSLRDGDVQIDGIQLTQREAQVARRLGEGLSVTRIAGELGISANTVGVHRDNLRKKLHCGNMVELVALLARHRKVLDG